MDTLATGKKFNFGITNREKAASKKIFKIIPSISRDSTWSAAIN